VWLVERMSLAIRGVAGAELDVGRARVTIRWDASLTPLSQVARTLDALGYTPHPCRGLGVEALRRAEDRAMLVRIGIAGALAGNIMLLAVALYSGWFSGMEPVYEHYFRWVSLALVAPSVLIPGQVFFRGAWSALRSRTPHMDLPIALALGAGFVRGAVNTVTNHGPIYFDGVALLIFLLLVGRFLQQRAHRAATDSAELLHALSPATARRVEGDELTEVPTEALLPGMVIEVRPGETVAADGRVLEGRSSMDLSLLTGETRATQVEEGSKVFAGTLNRSATLRVCVEQAGEDSRVGGILRQVENASRSKAPVVQMADRLASGFVLVVLALAAGTYLLWLHGKPGAALDNAIALLIVTCPCALALATPLAITVGIGRAAKAGILVKGGSVLDFLGRPGTLFLDKTGTVTEGKVTLVNWVGPEWVKPLVLALEAHSAHPIAAGFMRAWGAPTEPDATAQGVVHTAGGGIEGMVNGRRVVVGSPDFVAERLGDAGRALPAKAESNVETARTPVQVAVDGLRMARAGFGDRVRPEARGALDRLRSRGWRIRLLSGDHPEVVAQVGRELGFAFDECQGGASPEDKLRVIEAAEREGRVVMVGDGVNDAEAIARASAGVGVHGGAEACIAAADVYLARPGVDSLELLLGGAARTRALIRRNIAFSLVYNLAGTALAVGGVINPFIAALLMPASSLTVILSSWLTRSFEERSGA
jgi:Cu2+-exporting ATPase